MEVAEDGGLSLRTLPHRAHDDKNLCDADRSINSIRIHIFSSPPPKTFRCLLVLTDETLMRPLQSIVAGFLFTVAFTGSAMASDPGTTAADFLKLGVGPRAVAMGDAQVGLADDAYSTYWNPAGLATLRTQEASFVQTQYVQNISEEYLAYALPRTRFGAFGASATYLGYGSLQSYDATGQPGGSVGASDMALGLSWSHDLFRDERYGTELSAGVTGKWIQERLDTVSATAYTGDLGLLFSPGIKWGEFWNGWKAGLDLRNLGTPMTFDQESFPLPRTLSAGLSYTGRWRDESITLAFDGRQPNDGSRTMGVGLEIWTLQSFVLRGGYTTEGDLGNGLSFGAGIRFKTIQVDYAFGSEGPLGNTQRIGLTLRFAAPKENPVLLAQHSFEKGVREFNKGRYTESLVDFNKTLEVDPTHPQALEMMKRTYEKLKQNTAE